MTWHRASCIGRRVVDELISYVGLDVHKDMIAVAVAEEGKRGEVREHGKIANGAASLTKLASKLSRGGRTLKFCYEAGPCGYGIQRHLSGAGHDCVVVARIASPEMLPGSYPLPHLTCSRPGFTGGDEHEAGQHGNA